MCYKPLAVALIRAEGDGKTLQSSRRGNVGIPTGISKECGKRGKPAFWLSMLSILSHFHGQLFVPQCWVTAAPAVQCARNAYRESL